MTDITCAKSKLKEFVTTYRSPPIANTFI